MIDLKKYKIEKGKIQRISLIVTTAIALMIVLAIISLFMKGDNIKKNRDVYNITGNLLSLATIDKNYSLTMEEDGSFIYGITLKNNELVSKIELCQFSEADGIQDFTVVVNKDREFSYVSKKSDKGYFYKIYEIDNDGKIEQKSSFEFEAESKKASLKVKKKGDKYECVNMYFLYNGNSVISEVGSHEIENNSGSLSGKPIYKGSRISILEKYNAVPRKVKLLKEIPEYIENVNYYLKDSEFKQALETDLDGNGLNEYIVLFFDGGVTHIILLDNSANTVASLLAFDGKYEIGDKVDVADIDDDGIMEIIQEKDNTVVVHKYNNGFFY